MTVRTLWKIIRSPILFLGPLLAIQSAAWGFSKYAGEFLSLGVGARPMGMGGAYAAISDDASAIYWNPAGLVHVSQRQVMFMHAESFGGLVGHDYLGVVLPLEPNRSALGIGLLRLGIEDIPYTEWNLQTQRPRIVREVNDAEYALFLSYARSGWKGLSLGGSAKLIRKGVGDDHALGLGVDAGVFWYLRPSWVVGVKLADMTTTPLVWNSGQREYILPMLKLGTAYKLTSRLVRGAILIALDADTRFEDRDYAAWASVSGVSFDPRAGFEYCYQHRIALRAGIEPDGFSAGAGIRLGIGDVDYAFLGHNELDNSHRLSVLVTF